MKLSAHTCDLHQLKSSAGWKLQLFIYFHHHLSAPAMSSDIIQVSLSFLHFNIIFIIFINWNICKQNTCFQLISVSCFFFFQIVVNFFTTGQITNSGGSWKEKCKKALMVRQTMTLTSMRLILMATISLLSVSSAEPLSKIP